MVSSKRFLFDFKNYRWLKTKIRLDRGFCYPRPMDPNQRWDVPRSVSMPRRDALDRESQRSADRSFSAKRVFAMSVVGIGLLAGGGVWYLADSTLGDRDRIALAPEISLGRYISHMRAGTRPLINQNGELTKPKYVQILGLAEELGHARITTNGSSYTIITYRLSPITNSSVVLTNNLDLNTNFTNDYSISFQTRESLDSPSPFQQTVGSIPGANLVRLTVQTSKGPNVQVSSNEIILQPASWSVEK